MATFFTGGAMGSALGGWTYARGGWSLSMWVALSLPLLALVWFLTERSTAVGGESSTTGPDQTRR
jgi:predicted MFS family arabinose efflux permease